VNWSAFAFYELSGTIDGLALAGPFCAVVPCAGVY